MHDRRVLETVENGPLGLFPRESYATGTLSREKEAQQFGRTWGTE